METPPVRPKKPARSSASPRRSARSSTHTQYEMSPGMPVFIPKDVDDAYTSLQWQKQPEAYDDSSDEIVRSQVMQMHEFAAYEAKELVHIIGRSDADPRKRDIAAQALLRLDPSKWLPMKLQEEHAVALAKLCEHDDASIRYCGALALNTLPTSVLGAHAVAAMIRLLAEDDERVGRLAVAMLDRCTPQQLSKHVDGLIKKLRRSSPLHVRRLAMGVLRRLDGSDCAQHSQRLGAVLQRVCQDAAEPADLRHAARALLGRMHYREHPADEFSRLQLVNAWDDIEPRDRPGWEGSERRMLVEEHPPQLF